MSPTDPFHLARFLQAQEHSYHTALAELRRGAKHTHWMWFIFPQIVGLGTSPTAQFFALSSRREAEAYLAHPLLGPRLVECAEALLGLEGKSALEVMGFPDDLKLRSCATLFASTSSPGSVFHRLLETYFEGRPDFRTVKILQDKDRGGGPP